MMEKTSFQKVVFSTNETILKPFFYFGVNLDFLWGIEILTVHPVSPPHKSTCTQTIKRRLNSYACVDIFLDLLDWADPSVKGHLQPQRGTVRKLQRRSSQTGSLVEVNEVKVALFRYGDKVYAVNEKCPHAGDSHIKYLGCLLNISGKL